MIFLAKARTATLALLLSTPAWAQLQTLTLTGHLAHPRSFSTADLTALPHVNAELPPAHTGTPTQVSGILLWPLLDQAGFIDQPGRKTHEQHVIFARGQDGYTVALSIGELDPALEGKPILVVTGRDGKPADHLDLYVPGDHRAARRVHELASIDVQ